MNYSIKMYKGIFSCITSADIKFTSDFSRVIVSCRCVWIKKSLLASWLQAKHKRKPEKMNKAVDYDSLKENSYSATIFCLLLQIKTHH